MSSVLNFWPANAARASSRPSSLTFLALKDLLHLGFDCLEIVIAEAAGKQKIIIEAVGDLRADGVLYIFLAKDLDDRLSQDMGQGMAVY